MTTLSDIRALSDAQLDAAIAEEVMGWHTDYWGDSPAWRNELGEYMGGRYDFNYTRDLNQAWECVSHVEPWLVSLFDDGTALTARFENADTGAVVSASGSNPARVLCEALLATVREVE
jgi:hypothetical protein